MEIDSFNLHLLTIHLDLQTRNMPVPGLSRLNPHLSTRDPSLPPKFPLTPIYNHSCSSRCQTALPTGRLAHTLLHAHTARLLNLLCFIYTASSPLSLPSPPLSNADSRLVYTDRFA